MNHISVNVQKNSKGKIISVGLGFGPHYFLDLKIDKDEKLSFILGATHHGFKAEASVVGGELEKFINEIRTKYPEAQID